MKQCPEKGTGVRETAPRSASEGDSNTKSGEIFPDQGNFIRLR